MRSSVRLSLVLLCVTAVPLVAGPVAYTGSLSVAGGGGDGLLVAAGSVWNQSATTLSWTVDNVTTPGKWHYSYTLSTPGPGAAISHLIVGATGPDPGPAFTIDNLHSPASVPNNWIARI